MDHAIRRGGRLAQDARIVESAALDLCPGRSQRSGRGIRAGQPGDLMARAEEFGHHGGADPAGCAGDEYAHEETSR